MKLIREGILADFLLRGLLQDEGKLALPESGTVSKEEIDAISMSS